MKKENIKIGDCYEDNGNFVMVTNIINNDIYVSDVEFDEDGIPQAIPDTENLLTDYEVKNLKENV